VTDFGQLLGNLGITPGGARPVSGSAKDYANYRKATQPIPPGLPTASAGPPVAATGTSGPKVFANAVDISGPATPATPGSAGHPFGISDLFKQGVGKLFQAVDTGRAYGVSGLKEVTDALVASPLGSGLSSAMGQSRAERQADLTRMGTPSWKDFVSQGRRHIAGREVWDAAANSKGDSGLANKGMGFLIDVAGDPLTYITGGAGAEAGAGEKGLAVAVNDGGGKMLSHGIVAAAEKAGLEGETAVQKLALDAAKRGRGAITTRGLARNGITADVAEQLGIPRMARTLGHDGVRIPGTTLMTNAIEDVKGAAKNALRSRPSANMGRKMFLPDILGERALTKVVMDGSKSTADRFLALQTKSAINGAKAARGWGDQTMHRIFKSWKKDIVQLSDEEGVALTHAVETGGTHQFSDKVGGEFHSMLSDLQAAGVDIGDMGDNYVPHLLTQDFSNLAPKNADVADFVTKMDTPIGVAKHRTLKKGDVFLGETLVDGTIQEFNNISTAKLGVKVFEDDIRNIMPRYVDQASDLMMRGKLIQAMGARGISKDLSEKIVRQEIPLSPEKQQVLDAATKALAKARGAEKVALSDGSVLRRDQLGKARDMVMRRRADMAAGVEQIDQELKKIARTRSDAERAVAKSSVHADTLSASREHWLGVVRSERGSARRKAVAEVKKLDQRIEQATGEVTRAQKTLAKIMGSDGSLAGRVERGAPVVKSEAAWQAERAKAVEQLASTSAQVDELSLKMNPPGQGPLPSDVAYKNANLALEEHQLKHGVLTDQADAAANVVTAALADHQWAIKSLNEYEGHLDKMWAASTHVPEAIAKNHAELKDRANIVRNLLERTGGDEGTRALASLEAQALQADMAAALHGETAATMEQLIAALKTPQFADLRTTHIDPGMVMLGQDKQIPGWLSESLKVGGVTKNPIAQYKFLSAFHNLWKGYAILRPGFHVRNAYSGMFNIWLEGGMGALASGVKFDKFYRMMRKDPENFMARATAKWGEEEAGMLKMAWDAAAATGAGQTAGEFKTSAMHASGWNPLSSDNKVLRASRAAGANVEDHLRGTHAFDVLRRGGSFDDAVNTVQKWHFNYTDITQFDQGAKIAAPFWMFYSRNLALQAQTFVKNAPKLNRSYMNVMRNMQYGTTPDSDVPQYFGDASAIRLPGQGNTPGSVPYLFPDIPQMQAASQFDDLSQPWNGKALANLGPIKLPLEAIMGKQLFSGIPFKDAPTQAGSIAQVLSHIPGQPGVDMNASGDPMMNDRLQYMLNGLIPGAPQLDRLLGIGSGTAADRQNYSQLAWATGMGVRDNNDATRKGEQYRLLLEKQKAAKRQKALGS
jgi:hypothetical protein